MGWPKHWSNFESGPKIPPGWRVYAIGDIHGRADLLETLLDQIEKDLNRSSSVPLFVFLGDYIDRGPDSRGVIEQIIALSAKHRVVCLKGNHEVFILDYLADPNGLEAWHRYGAFYTLTSYGIVLSDVGPGVQRPVIVTPLASAMPQTHLSFLKKLYLSFTFGDFFFVHAGVRPKVPLAKQAEEDLLWIREDFLLYEESFEKIIVHGHTPVRQPEVFSNRINIDTGAYATGRLTCLVIEGRDLNFL